MWCQFMFRHFTEAKRLCGMVVGEVLKSLTRIFLTTSTEASLLEDDAEQTTLFIPTNPDNILRNSVGKRWLLVDTTKD